MPTLPAVLFWTHPEGDTTTIPCVHLVPKHPGGDHYRFHAHIWSRNIPTEIRTRFPDYQMFPVSISGSATPKATRLPRRVCILYNNIQVGMPDRMFRAYTPSHWCEKSRTFI